MEANGNNGVFHPITSSVNGVNNNSSSITYDGDIDSLTHLIGGRHSLRDVEILRIIGQFLFDLGFKETYNCLVRESGIVLEHKAASRLRQHILEGQWDEAETSILELGSIIADQDELDEMRFLVLEQRFLEHLEDFHFLEALMILRNQITPMDRNIQRVHTLASCIMCRDAEELKTQALWSGKAGGSRSSLVERLQSCIPPVAMLPPRRMQTLMEEAVRRQMAECLHHNTLLKVDDVSLLTKHECDKTDFPTCCIQTLSNDGELCACRFSPDGNLLATGGRDGSVHLWHVSKDTHLVSHLCLLDSSINNIKLIAWSPDSTRIAVCCGDEQSNTNVYLVSTGELLCSCRILEEEVYTAAAFFPDSKKLAFGGIKGYVYVVDTDDKGRVVERIEGYRVQSLACSEDVQTGESLLFTADTLHRVRVFRFVFPSGPVPGAGGAVPSTLSAVVESSGAGSGLFHHPHEATVTSSLQAIGSSMPPSSLSLITTTVVPPLPSLLHVSGVGLVNISTSAATSGAESASGPSTPTLPTAPVHGQPGSMHSMSYSVGGSSSESSTRPGHSDSIRSQETLFQESHPIQTIVVSRCGKYALIMLHKMGLTLWDLQDRVIVARYQGFKQEDHVIHPTFGGVNEDFVACGSEDGTIHIWQRWHSKPIISLAGQRQNVVSVDWNPGLHSMLASINDDGQLKIWAPQRFQESCQADMLTD